MRPANHRSINQQETDQDEQEQAVNRQIVANGVREPFQKTTEL